MKHRKQPVYSLIYHILPYRTNRYFSIFVIAMQLYVQEIILRLVEYWQELLLSNDDESFHVLVQAP